MADEVDLEAAVAAYVENAGEGLADAPDAPPSTEPAAPNTPEPAATPAPTDSPQGDLPEIDLSDLSPAQRAFAERRIVDMQRKMTEVTTEAAQLRKAAEAVGGIENLNGLIAEVQALQDPASGAAENLYQSLRTRFEAQGATPQQAAAAAATQTQQAIDGDLSEYDLPPELVSQIQGQSQTVNALQERLAALEGRDLDAQQRQAQAEIQGRVEADLTKQWGDLLEVYPDLGANESTLKHILALGASPQANGNLAVAHDIYREIVNGAQAAMYDGATSVPGGVVVPPNGAGYSAEPPAPIETVEDANVAAEAWLKEQIALMGG